MYLQPANCTALKMVRGDSGRGNHLLAFTVRPVFASDLCFRLVNTQNELSH